MKRSNREFTTPKLGTNNFCYSAVGAGACSNSIIAILPFRGWNVCGCVLSLANKSSLIFADRDNLRLLSRLSTWANGPYLTSKYFPFPLWRGCWLATRQLTWGNERKFAMYRSTGIATTPITCVAPVGLRESHLYVFMRSKNAHTPKMLHCIGVKAKLRAKLLAC